MELFQGNQCITILNKQECHYFLQKQRTGGNNRSCLGSWYQWEEEDVRKGSRRVNMVQILCTHVCKWKK
jgi:hypothetical protein